MRSCKHDLAASESPASRREVRRGRRVASAADARYDGSEPVTIVVTGGAGFIGSNLCARLLSAGHTEVRVVDDFSTGLRENVSGLDVDVIEVSVADAAAVQHALRGATAVVHLAARASVPRSVADPRATHDANATGTLNVLEAARSAGVPHLVVASSSSVYGANPALPKREDMVPAPLSPYAASKLATESYALAWQHTFGIGVLALRFFNVFGPRQQPGHAYAAVIPAFVHAALRGEPLVVHGDGEQSRDFTFVGTVCDIIAQAVERGVTSPGPVNLAFGTRTSLLELIGMIEDRVGHVVEREHVGTRAGDVRHSQADNAVLRSLFPGAKPADLGDGLDATIAWMRAHLQAR